MRPASYRRLSLAVAVSGALLAAGCSDDTREAPAGPAVEDFAAGSCRQAAPDVLELSRLVEGLGKEPRVPDDAKAALRAAQGRLAATAAQSSGPERADLDAFVQKVGLLRLRADGNTYEPFLADDVRAARDRVIASCTAP